MRPLKTDAPKPVFLQCEEPEPFKVTKNHLQLYGCNDTMVYVDPPLFWLYNIVNGSLVTVRHVTGNDKDYLRKIPRVVW
jgi:hypothetical protein